MPPFRSSPSFLTPSSPHLSVLIPSILCIHPSVSASNQVSSLANHLSVYADVHPIHISVHPPPIPRSSPKSSVSQALYPNHPLLNETPIYFLKFSLYLYTHVSITLMSIIYPQPPGPLLGIILIHWQACIFYFSFHP